MSIKQVVHAFDIMTRFHIDHLRMLFEQIYPLLRIPVVLDKILPDECVPAITLVQVQAFIESGLFDRIIWQMFFEKLFDAGFVFFISRMAVLYVPAIKLE